MIAAVWANGIMFRHGFSGDLAESGWFGEGEVNVVATRCTEHVFQCETRLTSALSWERAVMEEKRG